MRHGRALIVAAAAAGGAMAWGGVAALQTVADERPALPLAKSPVDATVAKSVAPALDAPDTRPETPMAERVALLGVLNKRNGEEHDVSLHPGQAVRVGDAVVRLRACETTGPWEPEQLTGAFVQLDTLQRDGRWSRVFSGWLYKETPSLNVVENPIYDVWPKSCAMTHPDIGPDTELASAVARGGAVRSSAKKSPDAAGPTAPGETDGGAAAVPESASSNKAR